ncbi:MAG: hypothetical protein V4503_12755 [Gemmatimonadota bacterium]
MTTSNDLSARPAALFTRRNLLLIGVALATIGAGYAVLVSGSPGAAAVLLVAGYCVLFPLALLA